VYSARGDYKRALDYYNKSIHLGEELGSVSVVAPVCGQIAEVHYQLRNYSESEKYLKKALKLNQEIGSLQGIQEVYKDLALIDSTLGNYKSALENYKNHITIKDSIANEENTQKQTRLEMQFEFDKKQAADSVKVAEEKKVAAAELRAEQNKSYSLYGGLGLVLIFAGFMYNRFRITQKQKRIIEDQKLLVESQKKIVEEKNKAVVDSIYYARRIQKALVTNEKYFEKHLRKFK
jgi:tetratricopeptide (TPR) repeat protein